MRILIYSTNLRLNRQGSVNTQAKMAAWLRGSRARVCAWSQHRPIIGMEDGSKYVWPPFRRERWRGVDVLARPAVGAEIAGGFTRILHLCRLRSRRSRS